jgi:long-chain acyl-CoA synthetase
MNLASIIEDHPADAAALISRGRTTTYGELREQVAGLRGGLIGLGLEPGDRVAIVMANNWYFVVSYLAVLGAGCVAVPINPMSPAPEMTRELTSIGARAVIAGSKGIATLASIERSALPDLQHVIASRPGPLPNALLFEEGLASPRQPIVERAADDLAVLIFTSGTAGAPKAAKLTHGNLLANLQQCQDHPGRAQTADDVAFGVLPFFHIFGLNVVLGLTLMAGATTLAIERFDRDQRRADDVVGLGDAARCTC